MYYIHNLIYFIQNVDIFTIRDIGIAIFVAILFKILSFPLTYIIIKMFNFKVKDKKRIKGHSFYKPLRIFFTLLGIYLALYILNLPYNIFAVITRIFRICTILLVANGLANLFSCSSNTYSDMLEKLHIRGSGTTLTFISKIIKILIYIVAGFMILADLGYDLGGLAAGIGISGVVIALATQDIARSFLRWTFHSCR